VQRHRSRSRNIHRRGPTSSGEGGIDLESRSRLSMIVVMMAERGAAGLVLDTRQPVRQSVMVMP